MSWQIGSLVVLVCALGGGIFWYEKSKPPSQIVALVAVLAALAVAGRIVLAPIPNVVATTDVVFFAGYALGPAPGFAVGALVTFFGVTGMRLSLTTVVIAHIAFCISYVAIVVRARLAGFDRSLEEAASDLGAGPWDTFRRVTLPIILPGIIAGALLVFTISIDDYVITSFVAGVGATTLPIQIYSMLKVGVTPEVNAVSTLLLLLTVVLIVIAQRLQQEPTSKGGNKK